MSVQSTTASIAATLLTDSPIAVRAREQLERWGTPDAGARFGLGVTDAHSTSGHLVVPVLDGTGAPAYSMYRALRPSARCRACKAVVTAVTMSARASTGGDWRRCPECDASNNRARLAWLVAQHPLWRADAGAERVLYNADSALDDARRDGVLHIVEGHRDVWALDEVGLAAVGLGSAWISVLQLEQLRGLRGVHVVLCADDDRTGRAAARTNRELVHGLGLPVDVVSDWRGAKDPAGILERDGTEELLACLDAADG